MRWGAFIGITVITLMIAWYQWPKMNQGHRKDKAAFVVLSAAGWAFGIIVAAFPHLTSPMTLLDKLFEPLSDLLE